MSIEKVAVIGLDCCEPSLVFDRWRDDLPNLRRLMESGLYGCLESCMPPITVPAWSCMTTGRDPGTLGIYGFRNRRDHGYGGLHTATSLDVRHPRVWDMLGAAGKASIVVGVPQTFPIVRPPNGCMVSCFLTPSTDSDYTHPPGLKREIAALVGEYMVDVPQFRTEDKTWLWGQIHTMTDRRFKVCKYLLRSKPWDLFFMVEIGVDRIHHGFWRFMDPDHRFHVAGNPYEQVIHDYYVRIDHLIGELLAELDLDTTAVWIVSDHGAKRLEGGVCFNDWLIREGLLVMKDPVTGPQSFRLEDVDWSRTQVWGEGGYYGRCFINLAGREPRGIVPQSGYESLRQELISKLEAMHDPQGNPLGTRVYKPEALYSEVNGVAPDLIVIFGDLYWRSVGTVGNADIYTTENDTGPDDANHAQQGMHILHHPSLPSGRCDASIYDVAPTILDMLGHEVPEQLHGVRLNRSSDRSTSDGRNARDACVTCTRGA
ncbi:MAG: alkaline phosphatase family protein [Phycisphaerales bacterium]|nr:alkaline phosphatase family protein [Phycisphaerales bacterium]